MTDSYLTRAREIRNDPQHHSNCAQAVLEVFAPDCGLTGEQAHRLGAHFGSGMKMGATCGAITGALMVIGLLGGDEGCRREFLSSMKANHEQMTDCCDLLKKNAEAGRPKKQHCDELVYEAVEGVVRVMNLQKLPG